MYNHNLIEKKWQKYWHDQKTFIFKNTNNPKFYILDMFPYPSGQGLHVGHIKGYTATDIISRYKRLNGFDVLHPIGWDAFGLPAEHYALQTGNHPESFTRENINNFRRQLISAGFDFDFDKEVNTTDPKYYKWTQWIFSKLFENGLAEIRDIDVNWCEELGTALANEEVLEVDNKMVSERGGYPVIKKPMRQWVLKITAYAEKLLDGLNEINWPENLKNIQRNWIGKSIGANVKFKIENLPTNLEIFTTRVDTIFGVSYIALAPEHPLILKLATSSQKKQVESYLKNSKTKTDLLRKQTQTEKTGVFTGSYANHPITNKLIPIWIADYVLNDYANAAVMGVPAHDQRDFDFAKKYHLDIIYVIETNNYSATFLEDGIHINSEFLNGLNTENSIKLMNEFLLKNKIGETKITYKLKDWIFSRQRYWGEPFPILFDKNNNPIIDKSLPIILPKTNNIKPTKNGLSPLANLKEWVVTVENNQTFTRETNTMPQWAGSCWYYLAYLMKQADGNYLDLNSKTAYSLFEKWLPVDLYVGGQEHAVLHLLYARFWHRFLYDIKIVPTKEPFYCVINQGMVLGDNNEKMSKSRGNVVNPDEIFQTHGADALRIYECFSGPLIASFPWNTDGLNGSRKWLERVYNLFTNKDKIITSDIEKVSPELIVSYHRFVKAATESIELQQFNLVISQMMIYINECYKNNILYREHLNGFLIILSCFAPHLSEELWSITRNKGSVCLQQWPKFNEEKTIENLIILPIQENGKLRHTVEIKRDLSKDEVINLVLAENRIKEILKGKKIKKTIYVPNKIVNFII